MDINIVDTFTFSRFGPIRKSLIAKIYYTYIIDTLNYCSLECLCMNVVLLSHCIVPLLKCSGSIMALLKYFSFMSKLKR